MHRPRRAGRGLRKSDNNGVSPHENRHEPPPLATHVTAEHFPILAKLKKTGFDGVEVPLFEGDVAYYKSIRKELDNHGLRCTTVTCVGPDHNPISADAKVRGAALERLKWRSTAPRRWAARSWPARFILRWQFLTGAGPTADEKKRAADVLRQAAEFAQQAKVMLAIEYLNRFECYFLTTAAEARALVKAVNHAHFRTMYDTFHANIEEKDITQAINSLADSFVHVHISENDRGTPGTGHVHWDETSGVAESQLRWLADH